MGWLDFFRKPAVQRTPPPASAVVTFDNTGITCTRRSGLVESVSWSELRAVLINTTSDGPLLDDLYWVLVGQNSGCVVPSEAEGCNQLLERLQQLPGFDNKATIRAAQCIDEQSFLCWEKKV